ncbi:glutathione S-transferase family protein [Solimonas terrae]|uniref:Glutathione S-transferase family protein n=1 Tax=Solimonas terrae TaxID=1396819 RepID=A0A6M2BQW1_9GAMM|nr:glutathione S-transferase family protein [Solimonas terrae]NGY05022.1 glutathione S-transferase family protein [Solimonas terrae]
MKNRNAEVARFITIPLSHYCEKARWALDRAALPYREEPHIPLLHRLSTKRSGGGTVPVLIHAGRCFVESTAILVLADNFSGGALYPQDAGQRHQVESLVARFDRELGPHTRRWAYAQLLSDTALLRRIWATRAPRAETLLLPVIVPLARRLVRAGYRVTPESGQRSIERVHGIFREVEERLRDGRRYLVGDRFSAADLGFAALAAPVLFPAGCRAVLPALDEVPAAVREEVLRLRDTDAGRFALRLYLQERDTPAAARSATA